MNWDPQWAPIVRLIGVLVLLVVVAWGISQWLKRRPGGASGNRQLRVITAVAVGTRERVVLLEVEGERVLIGVTPQQITSLWHKGFAQTIANVQHRRAAPSAHATSKESLPQPQDEGCDDTRRQPE